MHSKMIINEHGFPEWYESEFIKGKDGGGKNGM